MRAAVLHRCGSPPTPADIPRPVPGPADISVRVIAAPVTPLDKLCATGTSYFGAPATPYVPGVQGVGTRDDGAPVWFATGAGMRPGDGSLAEHVAVAPLRAVRPIQVRPLVRGRHRRTGRS